MLESQAGWMLERRTTCPDRAGPASTNRDSAPDGPLPPLNPAGNPGSNHASRLPGESVLRIFAEGASRPSEGCPVALPDGANMHGSGSPSLRSRVEWATLPLEPRRTGCHGVPATKIDDRAPARKFLAAAPRLRAR